MLDIDKVEKILKDAKEMMSEKCHIFNFDIYVKFDVSLRLIYDLHSFENNTIILSFGFPLNNLCEDKLQEITERVIYETTEYFNNSVKMDNCWKSNEEKIVLLLDIMGFKSLVSNGTVDDIYLKLYKIFSGFKNLEKTYNMRDKIWVEQFSDTILIIASGINDAMLCVLNVFISEILNAALSLGILFKGAFAKGNIIVDKKHHICFGQPIIDAYLLEEEQAWFGIVCHDSITSTIVNNIDKLTVVDVNNNKTFKPLFTYYDVPLKGYSKKILTCAWFNNPGIEVGKVINKLEELKRNSPDHIVKYYDKTLDFIKYTNNLK